MKSWTRKHKVATAVASTLLVMAATALAFYLLSYMFEGSGKTTLGSSTPTAETLTVTIPSGLKPGETEALGITSKPPTEVKLAAGAKLTVAFADNKEPECKASWFKLETPAGELASLLGAGSAKAVTFPAATTSNVNTLYGIVPRVEFKEEAAVNQSACEGAELTITAKLAGHN